MSASPFLGRDEHRPSHRYNVRFDQARRDRDVQKLTLEKLRYKWYVRRGTLSNFMQRLGNWGRKHFPWIGQGGWNGIGGQRSE